MKHLTFILALTLGLLVAGRSASAQTSLNSTTLSAAITATQTRFLVASTANITAGDGLFIPTTGELMSVVSIPLSGTVIVRRSVSPTRPFPAATSALAVITKTGSTVDYDKTGPCTGAAVPLYLQSINLLTGTVSVCLLSGTWQGRNAIPITQPTTLVLTP